MHPEQEWGKKTGSRFPARNPEGAGNPEDAEKLAYIYIIYLLELAECYIFHKVCIDFLKRIIISGWITMDTYAIQYIPIGI